MFQKDYLAVSLGTDCLKIMLGNRKKVKQWDLVKISQEEIRQENIDIMDFIYNRIRKFIRQKKVKADEILFSIPGSEAVTRHIEVPFMDKKGIQASVEWEMNQYLPGGGDNHYMDFQIMEKIEDEEKKAYKLLVAAVPRERIDKIYELSNRLKLKLRAVDISPNSIARVFRGDKIEESIGVIELGEKVSSIIILDKGNLFVEREVPFGTENVIREIGRRLQIENEEAAHYLREAFTFNSGEENIEVDMRIQSMFDNVFDSFLKVIQFYTTGRVKKPLDEIYVIGSACYIHGLEGHMENYFNSPASIVNSIENLSANIKIPKACDIKLYLNTIGLLLRKE